MTVRALLFDKDGTLFDFQASWAGWTAALIDELCAGDPRTRRLLAAALGFDIGTGRFLPDSPVIAGTLREVGEIIWATVPGAGGGMDALTAELGRRAASLTPVPAVPLAPLMSRFRRAGLKLGVATNDAEVAARAHLGPLADGFDFIAGYDSGHGAKPGPGMLLAFAEVCALEPRSVLMVGDSAHDLLAGRAAGMGTVAVLTGVALAQDLAPLADHVLPDIGFLPGLLGLAGD